MKQIRKLGQNEKTTINDCLRICKPRLVPRVQFLSNTFWLGLIS